jgi:hypothetical protein
MIGDVGADEARAAGDQNLRHPPSFFICSFHAQNTGSAHWFLTIGP